MAAASYQTITKFIFHKMTAALLSKRVRDISFWKQIDSRYLTILLQYSILLSIYMKMESSVAAYFQRNVVPYMLGKNITACKAESERKMFS